MPIQSRRDDHSIAIPAFAAPAGIDEVIEHETLDVNFIAKRLCVWIHSSLPDIKVIRDNDTFV